MAKWILGSIGTMARARRESSALNGARRERPWAVAPKHAVLDPNTQQPASNGRRDIWVTYTALTTALNSSYMASQLSLFGIVVGVALLLAGIGFAVLAIGGALRSAEPGLEWLTRPFTKHGKTPAVPTA